MYSNKKTLIAYLRNITGTMTSWIIVTKFS